MTVKEFYSAINGDYSEILERLGNEDRIRRFLKKMLDTGDMTPLRKCTKPSAKSMTHLQLLLLR